MKKFNVMIGPTPSGSGGISSVIDQYQRNDFFSVLNIRFLASWQNHSAVQKAFSIATNALTLIFWCLTRQVNLLHVHSATNISFFRKSLFCFIAILFRVPVIFHIHAGKFFHDYRERSFFYKKWVEFILKKSTSIVALSQYWSDEIATILKHSDNIEIIPNPIDLTLHNERPPRSGDKLRLLFMGGLTREKGFFDLISAASKAKKKGLDIEVRCGGTGDIDAIQALIDAEQLNDSIILLGWINGTQKIQELENADVFVLPSYFEGQPMSILEAMQADVLVISTTVGGIPDSIKNGHNGLLIKAGDVAALAAHIEHIYRNPEFGSSMVVEAKKLVESIHAPKAVLNKLKNLYKKINDIQY